MTSVWITGAKGFIGSHLAQSLSAAGTEVLGLGHGAWPDDIARKNGVSFWVNGEIEDANLWQLLKRSGEPAAIYHLAGGSSVGFSMQTPREDFHRTVTSTATLLEWMRIFTPKTKLIAVSSAAVYGNSSAKTLTESGNYTPYSPYGFHKRVVETLCQSYAENFGLNVNIVRLFSIYGPGLSKQLIWDLCCKLSSTPTTITLHGTGQELRDWVYIKDAVRILEAVCKDKSHAFTIINGGSGHGTTVSDVVSQVCQSWKQSPNIIFSGQQRPGDPMRLVADTKRLDRLGLKLEHDLEHGVDAYVKWFQAGR